MPVRTRWLIAAALLMLAAVPVAYRAGVLHEEARRLVIVVPPGTAERIAAGDGADAPPHRIELVLGVQDVLVIHNQDDVWHQVGPYRVAPGHMLIQRFTRPGVIRQACTITPNRQVEIVVRERGR
jgi:hypothetical protein